LSHGGIILSIADNGISVVRSEASTDRSVIGALAVYDNDSASVISKTNLIGTNCELQESLELSVGSITTTGGRKTVHCGLNSAGAARRREMKFEYIITRASLTVGTHRLIRERSKTEVCGRERS